MPCHVALAQEHKAYRAANPTPKEAASALIANAPNLFRAAGIASSPLVEEFRSRRLVQRLFRKVEEEVVNITDLGTCWVVGEAPWRVPGVSERGDIAYRTTAIVDSVTSRTLRPNAIIQVRGTGKDGVVTHGTTIGWEGDYIHDREGHRTGREILADLIQARLKV